MADWVLAVERAYVAAATRPPNWRQPTQPPFPPGGLPRALAAMAAVASRYLAVGTPRTFGLILAAADQLPIGQLSIDAHRTWFAPREIRCALIDGTKMPGAVATVAEALAADIVCVYVPIEIKAAKLRRGTHINALAAVTLDDDLGKLATVIDEVGLGRMAAGHIDGRQLDELTVFLAGDAQIALQALASLP